VGQLTHADGMPGSILPERVAQTFRKTVGTRGSHECSQAIAWPR
jgi:hypothetical protein